MGGKSWSSKDIEYLKENYSNTLTWELQKTLNRSKFSIQNMARKHNLHKDPETKSLTDSLSKTNINHNYFKTWTPNMAYIVGFIYADGCIHSREYDKGYAVSIKLQNRDAYILQDILNELNSPLSVSEGGEGKKVIRFSSKIIYEDLMDIGLEPRKTYGMDFPTSIPGNMIPHFIRGFCDGDGSIKTQTTKYKNKDYSYPVVKFVGPPEFLRGLQETITKTIGLKEKKLYRSQSSNVIKVIQYAGKDAMRLMHYMYKDADLKLTRKYNRYLQFCGNERVIL